MDDGLTGWEVRGVGMVIAGGLSFPQLHGSRVLLGDQLI